MAIDLEIAAVPKKGGQAWVLADVRWLQESALPAELLATRREIRGAYCDWVLVLTRDELKAWHQACVGKAYEGYYGAPEWRAVIGPQIAAMEQVLDRPQHQDEPWLFLAIWSQWESGLE